jgi:hypothetical protein
VNFYRPDKFDVTGETVSLDAAPDIDTAASEKAKTLRARALRYRQLCMTFYNQDLVAEVEGLARELEERAAKLEVGSYSFFRAALRASAGRR